VGSILGPQSAAMAASLRGLSRMRTGIMELDDVLDGGFVRGSTVDYLAESSGGKSMALVQGAACSALQGLLTCYATFELAPPIVMARILANLTGVPVNAILFEDGQAEESARRLVAIQQIGFGGIVVKGFTPQVSTVADVLDWVKHVERELGRPVDNLVVDYGDKVAPPKTNEREATSTYKTGLLVFEGLRVWASDGNRWCLTASQAGRSKDKRKKLDLDDVADSMHKVRVVPVVITLNKRGEEGDQILFYVAKNTLGKAGLSVGPLPTEYECARIAPVMV
jgi:KaiC/GvpD/RAD55 family RecA-like ATPase